MTATVHPFPARCRVVPFAPRAPGGGLRHVVEALAQRVDIWRDGALFCTDIELGEAAICWDAISDQLGPVLRQIAETGKAQVDDLVLRLSDTGGRAA